MLREHLYPRKLKVGAVTSHALILRSGIAGHEGKLRCTFLKTIHCRESSSPSEEFPFFCFLPSTELVVDLIELSTKEGALFVFWHITQKETKELIDLSIIKLPAFPSTYVSNISWHCVYEKRKLKLNPVNLAIRNSHLDTCINWWGSPIHLTERCISSRTLLFMYYQNL